MHDRFIQFFLSRICDPKFWTKTEWIEEVVSKAYFFFKECVKIILYEMVNFW